MADKKDWITEELTFRGEDITKAGSTGEMKLNSCWDTNCGSKNCSINIFSGVWNCWSHKGLEKTRKGNLIQGIAIADGKSESEVWEYLKSKYTDFNELNSVRSNKPKKQKQYPQVPADYINKTESCLHSDDPLSKEDLKAIIQKQALTLSTIRAARLGFDPKDCGGRGRYIIPVFERDGSKSKIINAKRYDPKSSDSKYFFYVNPENKNLKYKTTVLYPQLLFDNGKILSAQLSFQQIVIVEGMFTALCLIPFLNPMEVGVVCQIGGANSNKWLVDAEIRRQLVGKTLLILSDIDRTGIEAGKRAAKMLKHKGENTVSLANLWDVISIYKDHEEHFVYGAESSDPNPNNKILNADAVDWIKAEAVRANISIPEVGDDWPETFVQLIQNKFLVLVDKAVEQVDSDSFTDENGDIIVNATDLFSIAKLYLEKMYTVKDMITLYNINDEIRIQDDKSVIFRTTKKGQEKCKIAEFLDILKMIDKDGRVVKLRWSDSTVNSIFNLVTWITTVDDKTGAFLVHPELSPEFPDSVDSNILVMNTGYVSIKKFLKTGDLNDITQIPKTGNLYTPYERCFDFQIGAKGKKIEKTVKEIWWPNDEESQNMFWQMTCYFHYHGNPLQKCFFVFGPPGCGRSQALHIWMHQVGGKDRCWTIDPSQLDNRFAAGMLAGRTFISAADVIISNYKFTDKSQINKNLTNWTGGDFSRTERKNRDEKQEIIDSNVVLTGNEFFKLTAASTALMDRFRLLKMYRPFRGALATSEYKAKRKLKFWQEIVGDSDEMAFIQKNSLLYLPKLLEQQDFDEPKDCATGRNILETRSNPTSGFFKNALIYEMHKNCWTYKSDMTVAYDNYCMIKGIDLENRLGKIQLGEALVEFNPQVGEGKKGPNREWAWKFVRVKDEYKVKKGSPPPDSEPESWK